MKTNVGKIERKNVDVKLRKKSRKIKKRWEKGRKNRKEVNKKISKLVEKNSGKRRERSGEDNGKIAGKTGKQGRKNKTVTLCDLPMLLGKDLIYTRKQLVLVATIY